MRRSTLEAIKAEVKKARDIADLAEREDRDLTAEERGKVTEFLARAKTLKTESEEAGELLKKFGDLDGVELLGDDDKSTDARPTQFQTAAKGKTLGQQFVDSPEFKAMLANAPGGRFSDQSRVQSQPFGVKTLLTGANDSSAGALVYPDILGIQPPQFFLQRPLVMRQLFTQGSTTSDSVQYVQLLAQTINAAPVAEASGSGTVGDGTGGTITSAAGGVKPESGFTFQTVTTSVKTIAHWIPATKRALSDAAQVRTLIDQFLRYGLEQVFEDQLVGGDGTGENFLGIKNVSGIQTQAAPNTGAGEDMFTVLRRARRKVLIGARTVPTAFVLHPIDWENIELTRDAQKRFYGNGPFALGPNTLWGLPVVESEAVTQNFAWCANWNMGVIWDREQASMSVTDSHADFFIRNLVAILAEMRAAFGVVRPAAFCRVQLS